MKLMHQICSFLEIAVILLMLTLNTNQSVILEQNNMTFAILPIVTHIRTNEYQYLITSHMLCLIQ